MNNVLVLQQYFLFIFVNFLVQRVQNYLKLHSKNAHSFPDFDQIESVTLILNFTGNRLSYLNVC